MSEIEESDVYRVFSDDRKLREMRAQFEHPTELLKKKYTGYGFSYSDYKQVVRKAFKNVTDQSQDKQKVCIAVGLEFEQMCNSNDLIEIECEEIKLKRKNLFELCSRFVMDNGYTHKDEKLDNTSQNLGFQATHTLFHHDYQCYRHIPIDANATTMNVPEYTYFLQRLQADSNRVSGCVYAAEQLGSVKNHALLHKLGGFEVLRFNCAVTLSKALP